MGIYSNMAQDFETSYDHTALKVNNLERSAAFYKEVLNLKELKVPFENSQLKWFSLGEPLQLHLIEDKTGSVQEDIATHLALRINNMEAFTIHLKKNGISYRDWSGTNEKVSSRPDGVHQIYLQDPDGHWIEVNDAKY